MKRTVQLNRKGMTDFASMFAFFEAWVLIYAK